MKDEPELFCTECGNQLTTEDIEKLSRGETVYCTSCGHPVKVKIIKIDAKSEAPPSSSHNKSPSEEKQSSTKNFVKKVGSDIKKATQNTSDWVKGKIPKKDTSPNSSNSYSQNPSSKENSHPGPSIPEDEIETEVIPPNQYHSRTESSSSRTIPDEYRSFRKFNDFSGFFALLIAIIAMLLLIPNYIQYPSQTGNFEWMAVFTKNLIRIGIAFFIGIYDIVYVRRKILSLQFQNYGLDYILFGGFGLIAFGAGFFLLVKGFVVMIISFFRSTIDSKNKRFSDAVSLALNSVGGLYGIAILLLNSVIFFFPVSTVPLVMKIYAYLAIFAILIDLFVLRPLIASNYKKKYGIWLSIALVVCGVMACFFYFSGILILLQGVIFLLIEFFRVD
jgi:DNA-directed RNA polymerase subunit RPC12/RpoP